MPRDLALALSLVPLAPADRRRAAQVCKRWKEAMDWAWAEQGIRVRDDALACLDQGRWAALTSLRVYGRPDPRDRTPFTGLRRDLPRLRHLGLEHVKFGVAAAHIWEGVFASAPGLLSVEVSVDMWAMNYLSEVANARGLLLRGAECLTRLALRGHGLVLYHGGPAAVVRARGDAGIAISDGGMVCMPWLRHYVNTGRQFAALAVNAPLDSADIEEPDVGPWLVPRLGASCDALRSLVWRVPGPGASAGPAGDGFPLLAAAARFYRLRRLDLRVRDLRHAGALERTLDALSALPHDVERLALAFAAFPDRPADWRRHPLAAMRHLADLSIRVDYATRGFEEACGGLLGAPAGLERVTLGAAQPADRWPWTDQRDDTEPDSDATDEECDLRLCPAALASRVAAMLQARPGLTATCENLHVPLKHPRLSLLTL